MKTSYPCQACGASIALEDVNVANDIALCRACGKTMPFSDIAPIQGSDRFSFQTPPKGVSIEESAIHGRSIIYRKISPVVWFLIPFTAAWSGGSMFGIYGNQIKSGSFNPILSLFGLPFLIGTVVLLSIILFNLFGRWRVTCSGGLLSVALEIGFIGWTRRLVCDRTGRVVIRPSKWRRNNVPQTLIDVECQGVSLKFGAAIPDEPKAYIAEALRRTLAGE